MTDTATTSQQLSALFEAFATENAKFEGGNKAAGTRARKALLEITKLAKVRRGEIQDSKNAA